MEQQFERLGHEPLETGRQLQRLLAQKRRAQHAALTVRHLELFGSATGGPGELLQLLESADVDEAVEGCRVLSTLLGSIAESSRKEKKGEEEGIVLERIRTFAKAQEQRLVAEFQDSLAVEEGFTDKLARCYAMLKALNGGSGCRRVFVDVHPLVTAERPVASSVKSLYHVDTRSAMTAPVVIRCGRPEPSDPVIEGPLNGIITTLIDDREVIEQIFFDDDQHHHHHDSLLVMADIINRVLLESIRILVLEVLRQARQHSLLAHQRALHSLHGLFTGFCLDLDGRVAEGLSGLIADSVDSLLQPALGNLLSDEKACLGELLHLAGHGIEQHLSIKKAATSVVQPERAILFMFEDGRPLISPGEGADGLLTIDMLQRCLVLLGEASSRVVSLVGTATAEHLLPALLSQFLSYTGALITEQTDNATAPKLGFDAHNAQLLQSGHSTLTVIQIWWERYAGLLAASVSPGCYAECVRVKSDAYRGIEVHLNQLARKMINWSIDFIREFYFKQQKKTDFREPGGGKPTVVAQQLTLFLRRTSSTVRGCMEEPLAGPLLFHLGCRVLHVYLHEHMRRFAVSAQGALTVALDCGLLADNIPGDLGVGPDLTAQLTNYYGALRDLAKIYAVRPESIRAILQEGGALTSIDPRQLYPFLAMRMDARTVPGRTALERSFPDLSTLLGRMAL